MTIPPVPWLELAVLLPLVGAACVGRVRNPVFASRWCVAFAGATLACAVGAWARASFAPDGGGGSELQTRLLGGELLALDRLSAILLPVVALLHFLTTLATARTQAARVSFAWLLAGEAAQLATFACRDPLALGALLALGTLPPYFDLARRGRSTRAYWVHMGLFVGLLAAGLAASGTDAAAPLLMAAVLVRCGTVPAHAWVTDLFENGFFGTALLFVAPLTGVYAAVRLVLPTAPDWVLQGIGVMSLGTAVYAAGMAVVQQDARRFFAYLFLSHASLVLVGVGFHTVISLTGALALWGSVALSLGGLGLTLRAVEGRVGRLPLTEYRGLYGHSPALAVCFLLTGLAGVGFPGTLGFVATELVVDGAVGVSPLVGLAVLAAGALNGIALLRAYFLLFTGARRTTGVSLALALRERFVVLTLSVVILGGGIAPQFHIDSRHRAAAALLRDRDAIRPAPHTGSW